MIHHLSMTRDGINTDYFYLVLPLALSTLQPQNKLLGGLGLLSQDRLGLTSESLLLTIVPGMGYLLWITKFGCSPVTSDLSHLHTQPMPIYPSLPTTFIWHNENLVCHYTTALPAKCQWLNAYKVSHLDILFTFLVCCWNSNYQQNDNQIGHNKIAIAEAEKFSATLKTG